MVLFISFWLGFNQYACLFCWCSSVVHCLLLFTTTKGVPGVYFVCTWSIFLCMPRFAVSPFIRVQMMPVLSILCLLFSCTNCSAWYDRWSYGIHCLLSAKTAGLLIIALQCFPLHLTQLLYYYTICLMLWAISCVLIPVDVVSTGTVCCEMPSCCIEWNPKFRFRNQSHRWPIWLLS